VTYAIARRTSGRRRDATMASAAMIASPFHTSMEPPLPLKTSRRGDGVRERIGLADVLEPLGCQLQGQQDAAQEQQGERERETSGAYEFSSLRVSAARIGERGHPSR